MNPRLSIFEIGKRLISQGRKVGSISVLDRSEVYAYILRLKQGQPYNRKMSF